MLKVGNLTQNESNAIFNDSGSIKLTPIVSAEWNQNIFNPPYITSSGDAQVLSGGYAVNANDNPSIQVQDVTDPNLIKPNFITKSIITSNGKFVTLVSSTNTQEILSQYNKVVFFAKTNSSLPIIINAYPQPIEIYDTPIVYSAGSASVEINSFGWTKIELYTYHEQPISDMLLYISGTIMNYDDIEQTVYFTIPQYSNTTEFDYKYGSVYPTDSVFSNFRPGESYIRTGNDKYEFPSNFRKVKTQIFNTETKSGEYYGNKYMPVSSIINNPSFALLTTPVPFYKHSLVNIMAPYKYFISDIGSVNNPKISATYEKPVYTNKLVIKFNTLMSVPKINLFIDGIIQTVDTLTEIIPEDNGVLILYWTGSSWSKSTKWSTMPKFNEDGSLSKYTTFTRITVEQINKTTRESFTAYSNRSISVSNDLTRMQVIEISPRLEIDISDYIENVSINKSLDASNNAIPISSVSSDDATITISNIPVNKSNYFLPIFSSQSNLNQSLLKNILRKNIKFYINFRIDSYSTQSENIFTSSGKIIPGGIFYSDSWQENDADTVNVQCYDISRYLQSTPVPDYVANLKNVFEIITNILELAGYTDYDYDSLYNVCNSKTVSLDLAYYYCNSQDKTLISALSEIFLAYQIGAYIDEYGIMKFLSLSKVLENSSSDLLITDYNIVSDGYSVQNSAVPGKISLRYQPPKVKQSPAIQNIEDPKYYNSSSFIYTTSNDVVWSQQNMDSVGYNFLNYSFLRDDNSFRYRISDVGDFFHTFNLDANNYAIIEDEIVSFAYKEYNIFSYGTGETKVSVKNNTELQSEVSNFIKKYQTEIETNAGQINYENRTRVTLTGQITNVQRGLFGTKIKDHKIIPYNTFGTQAKDLTMVNCNSSYSISESTPFSAYIGSIYGQSLVLTPPANTKLLIYPNLDRDTGYKTYLTSFELKDEVSSAGLFFNMQSTSNTENTYFLELTRYNTFGNVGDPDYKYLIVLYYISGGTEKIVAWSDVTPTVKKIIYNDPTSDEKSFAFNLKICHYPSRPAKFIPGNGAAPPLYIQGDGEVGEYPASYTGWDNPATGELAEIFLNSFKITGWAVPKSGVQLSSDISYIEQSSSLTLKIYTNNTLSVGDNVRITGVVPNEYNIISSVISCTSSYIIVYGLFTSAYMYGGLVTKISSDFDSAWQSLGVNKRTKMIKKICLPHPIESNTIYGHFATTKSIASTMKLVDNYSMIPISETKLSVYFKELYACEKPLKEINVNYYHQHKEFLNGILQGYNMGNVKTYRSQIDIDISGLNIYDVQYPNPAAVSVDVLPIEYLLQYFVEGDWNNAISSKEIIRKELFVKENALAYSTPLNTGFRAKMAIANNSPYLVYLSKEPTATEQSSVKLNLWTHEIIAASDQQIIESVIDNGNKSEVVQIDSEWIQSKEAAYQIVNLISKSINNFSTTVDLEIFGNPLIQIGDKVTLTHVRSGINQQQYLVKGISHSFEQGLNTTLSLIKLSNGLPYSISNEISKIIITPSIPFGTPINKQQFVATAYDQYDNIISPQPEFSWFTSSGTISPAGSYECFADIDVVEVIVTSGSISGSIEFAGAGPKYNIYLDEKSGNSIPDIQYTPGSLVNLPSTTRSGYSFDGWRLRDVFYEPTINSTFYPAPHGKWDISTDIQDINWKYPYYFNGRFFITTFSGGFNYYSPNGISWTQITNPFTSSIRPGTVIGNSLVAVASADNEQKLVKSIDGINWTITTIPSSNWAGIAYGAGKYVLIAYISAPNNKMYSTDGITWTISSTLNYGWLGLEYGNGIFLSIAYWDNSYNPTDTGILSTDGVNWTTTTLPNLGDNWMNIQYINGKFFAFNNNSNRFVYTTDGLTWTIAYVPNNLFASKFMGFDGSNYILLDDGYNSEMALVSNNLINWNKEYYPKITLLNGSDVAYGNGINVFVNQYSPYYPDSVKMLARSITNDYTLYAKWIKNNPNQYTYTFNFESTIDAYAWLYPSTTTGDPSWWVDSWYGNDSQNYNDPTISQSTDYAHSGSRSMKVEWLTGNLDYPQAQLYLYSKEDFSEEIKSINISAWVYVPAGSPDVLLTIGDGQYAATYDPAYDPVYITPYASTSVKNQWVNLQLTVPIEDWQYFYTDIWGDLVNIEPISPNSVAGTVYVDDVVVTVIGL